MVIAATFVLPAHAEKTMSTDIAIVGGGLSGLAAGVQAIQGGGKVIVLEKQAKVGGTGNFCTKASLPPRARCRSVSASM